MLAEGKHLGSISYRDMYAKICQANHEKLGEHSPHHSLKQSSIAASPLIRISRLAHMALAL